MFWFCPIGFMCFILAVCTQMKTYTDWAAYGQTNKLCQLSQCIKRWKCVEVFKIFVFSFSFHLLQWTTLSGQNKVRPGANNPPPGEEIPNSAFSLSTYINFLSQHRLGTDQLKMLLHTSEQHRSEYQYNWICGSNSTFTLPYSNFISLFFFYLPSPLQLACSTTAQHWNCIFQTKNTLNAQISVLVNVHYMACQFIHPLLFLHAGLKHLKLSAIIPFYNLYNVKCYSSYFD